MSELLRRDFHMITEVYETTPAIVVARRIFALATDSISVSFLVQSFIETLQ